MIRNINLDNYKDPLIERIDGEDKYIDITNNTPRPAKDEEFVRQKFIRFLHRQLKIPYEAMYTEENLSHYIYDNHDRVDICVKRDTNKDNKIVMIVECKAPNVELTDDVYAQAKRYAEVLDNPVIIVTNGYELDCIKRNHDDVYEDVPELPTYDELANYHEIKTIPIEEYSYDRWSYDELRRSDVIAIERDLGNHVSSEGSNTLASHVLNLAECFLDTTHEIKDLPLENYEFVKDEGIYRKKAGNPIWEFVSNFRLVKIKDENENYKHLGFAVVPDPYPALFVGTYSDKFHNALELNLQTFMTINGDELNFVHDYRVYHMKQRESKELILKKELFEEDDEGNMILGNVNASKLLYCDNPEIEDLMANLIEYSLLRDELRKINEKETGRK